jgi:hypothetical protein
MARSQYIYTLQDNGLAILGAWTVRHELVSALAGSGIDLDDHYVHRAHDAGFIPRHPAFHHTPVDVTAQIAELVEEHRAAREGTPDLAHRP